MPFSSSFNSKQSKLDREQAERERTQNLSRDWSGIYYTIENSSVGEECTLCKDAGRKSKILSRCRKLIWGSEIDFLHENCWFGNMDRRRRMDLGIFWTAPSQWKLQSTSIERIGNVKCCIGGDGLREFPECMTLISDYQGDPPAKPTMACLGCWYAEISDDLGHEEPSELQQVALFRHQPGTHGSSCWRPRTYFLEQRSLRTGTLKGEHLHPGAYAEPRTTVESGVTVSICRLLPHIDKASALVYDAYSV